MAGYFEFLFGPFSAEKGPKRGLWEREPNLHDDGAPAALASYAAYVPCSGALRQGSAELVLRPATSCFKRTVEGVNAELS